MTLTHRRRLAGITAATAVASLAALAAPAQAGATAPAGGSEHNARVAEYLMQAHIGLNEHNARVSEYLLLHAR